MAAHSVHERGRGTDLARLEEASVPRAHFQPAFSASAIHWIDPDVSWRKLADAFVGGGTVALVSYFGLEDPRSADDQRALRSGLEKSAPVLAAQWPTYRDLEDAQVAAMPLLAEQTADALNALLGAMSFWARLSPEQRDALIAENQARHARLGRPIRSSTVACLVTARRAQST
jgi:hypothetical protein